MVTDSRARWEESYPLGMLATYRDVHAIDNYNKPLFHPGADMKDDIPSTLEERPDDAVPGVRVSFAVVVLDKLYSLRSVKWSPESGNEIVAAAMTAVGVPYEMPNAPICTMPDLLEFAKANGCSVDRPTPGCLAVVQYYPQPLYYIVLVEEVGDGYLTGTCVHTQPVVERFTSPMPQTLPVPNNAGPWRTIAYINFDNLFQE